MMLKMVPESEPFFASGSHAIAFVTLPEGGDVIIIQISSPFTGGGRLGAFGWRYLLWK
jgi:hypothetical protein